MGYELVIEKLNMLDPDSGERLDPFIYAAIAGLFDTGKLPPDSDAVVVLTGFYLSGINSHVDEDNFTGVFDFYGVCTKKLLSIALGRLKKSGFNDLAAIMKHGFGVVTRAEKQMSKLGDNVYYAIMTAAQDDFDEWIENNEERFHKLISSWVKRDSAELIRLFSSIAVPYDEACFKNANVLRGLGDNDNAIKLFMYAAESGNANAMFDVSEYCAVIKEDEKKALEWCVKAAEGGCADAQLRYAKYLLDMDPKKPDREGAVKWACLAAEQGHVGANFFLGEMYGDPEYSGKNAELAVKHLQKAADGGMIRAYYLLAPYYEKGDGVERDRTRAVEYYSIAAVCGQPSAQERLRKFPDMSDYMAKSEEIERLARGGNVYANYALGCFAEYGEDDEKSEEYFKKAVGIWREKAADGDVEAMDFLGMCYNSGNGVEEDQTMAYNLFTQAESKGFYRASFHIAQMYGYGEGVKYDPKMSNKYYLVAAEKGVADAMMYLGRNLDDGHGIRKNADRAKYWLERAANEGDDTCAHRCLAHMYDTVLKDPEKAREWRAKAAEKGDRTAQIWLARGVAKRDTEFAQYIESRSRGYEYAEYYDPIFEEIKDKLPYKNDKIKLVK